jgi:hypothetical protein
MIYSCFLYYGHENEVIMPMLKRAINPAWFGYNPDEKPDQRQQSGHWKK